jgi:hypothetical protein
VKQLPEEVKELMKVEFLNSQQDGMRLGIKFAAKTLRDIAGELETEPTVPPDYIRGLRDGAALIEDFAAKIPPNEVAR